jgi:hypothetical protein
MATTSDVSSGLPQRARGISSSDLLLALNSVRDDILDPLYSTFSESFTSEYRFTPVVVSAPTVALGTVAGNVDNGSYRYRVSFVTPEQEIPMGEVSEKVIVSDKTTYGKVSLTSIPVGASTLGVTARKIYRQQNGSGTYNLVDTISDNTTTTYTDNIAQSTVSAAAEGKTGFTLPSDFYYELDLKDGTASVPILKRSQVRDDEYGLYLGRTAYNTQNLNPYNRYCAWIDYDNLTINFPNKNNFSNELNLIYRPSIADCTAGATLPYPTYLHNRLLPILRLGTAFYYLADNKSGEGEMIARLQERYEEAKNQLFTGGVNTLY